MRTNVTHCLKQIPDGPQTGSRCLEPPAGGSGLAPLVILCCGQLPYTRLCLESVLRHTRAPFELILVDNGSTDGTPAYLEEIPGLPGPERVVVLRNESNRGYEEPAVM